MATPATNSTSPQLHRPSLLRRALDAPWLYRLIALGIFGGVWQLATAGQANLFLPTFTDTLAAIPGLLTDPQLWQAMWRSNQALVLGFAIAIILGIPVGLAMGRFRSAERFTNVYVNIMLVMPIAGLIPLLMMSIGIGLATRVVIVVLFSVTMVIVNSRAGIRQVDRSVVEMARCFGAGERDLWLRVFLPGSLPAIMTGVRIGLGRAVSGMVIVELLLVSVGLGRLIQRYSAEFQPARLYALIVVILLEALVLISIARWVERRVASWAPVVAFRE